jgi:hypothetical protein
MQGTTISAASNQWFSRPDDQRFLTLEDLSTAVNRRRELSHDRVLRLDQLSLGHDSDTNTLFLSGHNGAAVHFTHWSFGQMATQIGAPASYMRKLPAPLAEINMEYGMKFSEQAHEDTKLLYTYGEDGRPVGEARAFTGPTYGRIWDSQVVDSVIKMNQDGRWTVPSEFNRRDEFVLSKKSTTLYASDRDVFIFLVDEARPIEIDGQTYFRGFYTWNSEVGKATFGISTFLYSCVCSNRIIWGARNIEELRIRHTSMAPDRFIEEATPALAALSEASPQPIIDAIKKAKETRVAAKTSDIEKWLATKGFGKVEAKTAVALAERGGDSGSDGTLSVWDLVNGGTAAAREITHTDARIEMERKWSALLSEAR